MFNLLPWKKNKNIGVRSEEGLVPDYFGGEFYPMAHFRREFDQLWDRFWDDWGGLSEWNRSSRWGLDLNDNGNEYVLSAELPGFEPDEIDVSVSGNVMTVHAEHRKEDQGMHGSRYRYGQFHEAFTLPRGVESDKIDASYQNGLLEVHLPKSEECQAKRIVVKTA